MVSGNWIKLLSFFFMYKFNDEDIEKMKGNKLQLGTEDDPEETGAKQKGRCPKGYHSSRNAYMLGISVFPVVLL
jgi:hypothetical protein